MRAIGFKNFRKFTDFPMMEFAPITIFVGGNNAGKSTVVKGLLSLNDFLNSMPIGEIELPYTAKERQEIPLEVVLKQKKKLLKEQKFYFNTNPYTHIGTFERAINNMCCSDTITFDGAIGNYLLSVEITKGKGQELPYGIVSKVTIKDFIFNMTMIFDLFADEAQIELNPLDEFVNYSEFNSQKRYFEALKTQCSFTYAISDYWSPDSPSLLTSLMQSFNMAITFTLMIPGLSSEEVADLPYSVRAAFLAPKIVEGITDGALEALKIIGLRSMPSSYRPDRESLRYLRFDLPGMRYGFSRGFNFEYIYSHAVSQNVWYVSGASDYLSKTIHEFASEQKTAHKHLFVTTWMEKFSIGNDYEIQSVGGEAFRVKITNFDGSKTDLADKGMGTIQLMVLLFRLAITLPTKRHRRPSPMMQADRTPQIIIVEEPEQNIHPKLQSLLADLFYEMSTLGFRFIIETHSEYLIRNCQVLVGNEFKNKSEEQFNAENPFRIFYFQDQDVPYYDMEFTKVGGFKKKFGLGFFNEAGRLDSLVTNNKYDSL